MLIRNGRKFTQGLVLLISFSVIFVMLFLPIITLEDGTKENPLNYADEFFNELSKGSSYFVPEAISKTNNALAGKNIDITLHLKNEASVALAVQLARESGLEASVSGVNITLKGDLSKLVLNGIKDADFMYNNDDKSVSDRWAGVDAKKVLKTWHELLSASIKPLQRAEHIAEAQIVDFAVRKAIEPGYNFFGIKKGNVADHAFMLAFLLVFYVVYTMWYGFAIFDLFEGIGLSMKKAAHKEEA